MPKALDLVTVYAIFHYYQYYIRIIDTYRSELEYKIKQFTKAIYNSQKQVVYKLK